MKLENRMKIIPTFSNYSLNGDGVPSNIVVIDGSVIRFSWGNVGEIVLEAMTTVRATA